MKGLFVIALPCIFSTAGWDVRAWGQLPKRKSTIIIEYLAVRNHYKLLVYTSESKLAAYMISIFDISMVADAKSFDYSPSTTRCKYSP